MAKKAAKTPAKMPPKGMPSKGKMSPGGKSDMPMKDKMPSGMPMMMMAVVAKPKKGGKGAK